MKNNAADLVVFGTIYTAEEENEGLCEAFAVKDGKFIYAGDRKGAEEYIEDGVTEVIDHTGKGMIIPGCTDGHSHYFGGYGLNTQLPGSNMRYPEALKVLKEKYEKEQISQFLSFGWNGSDLSEGRALGKNFAAEIESAAPGIPVVLQDNTGHNAVCNTTALKMSGLLENPHVRGGRVDLDAEGKASGYLGDQAVAYVVDRVIRKPLTKEQYKEACRAGMNALLKQGYTNALDAFINMYDPSALQETLHEMDEDGEFTLNLAGTYNIKSYESENFRECVDTVVRLNKECRSRHFDPGYVKLFADGVVESATGWILEEYRNVPEGMEHGNQIWEPEELNELITYANQNGLTVHTHTYGDAAVKAVLDAYIASNKANGKEFRNCLAHVRNITKEDIARTAENHIPVAENLMWHTDYNENDPREKASKAYVLSMVPEHLFYEGYPMKSLFDSGIIVSSSTDAPAAVTFEGNAMNVLEVTVTGIAPHDGANPLAEQELLTIREGLQALTINGAWQLGLEKERGSIKEGKYADFVILDKNVLNYKGAELRTIGDTKILSTYFEGKEVYKA